MSSEIEPAPRGGVGRARAWFAARGLVRRRGERMIGGVCGAIAHRYALSPLLVRVLTVASILIPGPQVLAYLALWVLMPRER